MAFHVFKLIVFLIPVAVSLSPQFNKGKKILCNSFDVSFVS